MRRKEIKKVSCKKRGKKGGMAKKSRKREIFGKKQ